MLCCNNTTLVPYWHSAQCRPSLISFGYIIPHININCKTLKMREYIKILTTTEGQYYDWFLTLTLEALITFLIHIDSLYCTALLLFPIVIYSMLLAQQPATLQHYNQQQYIKRNWEIQNKRFRNSYKPWFWNQTNNKGCTIILYSYINLEYWQGRLWWLYNGWINTTSFTQSQSLHSCSCVLGELISLLSVSWEEDNWEPGSLFLKSYGVFGLFINMP